MIYFVVGAIGLIVIFSGGQVLSSSNNTSSFDDLFKTYGGKYGLDWKMLKAVCMIESSLGEASSVKRGLEAPADVEGSKSSDGLSWGLMQVTLATAGDYDRFATPEKLNNPEYSIKIASQHLRYLKTLFSSESEWVIKSYNQGQGNSYKEKRGEISGYADGYYKKYLNAYNSIEGI